jgi:hypothetical protein
MLVRVIPRLVVALALIASAQTVTAAPITIQFEATDLPDLIPGEDLWRYDFTVAGTLLQDQDFEIEFDYDSYADLDGSSPSVSWDLLVLQPEPAIPDVGRYNALALIDHGLFTEFFAVTFLWNGPGNPGSQPFTVAEYDAQGLRSVIASGQTTPLNVPEPGTLMLTASGLAYVIYRRRKPDA